jgi:hypothetical protein
MPPEACETSGGGSTGGRPARGHETAKVLRVLSQAPGFIRKATSRPTYTHELGAVRVPCKGTNREIARAGARAGAGALVSPCEEAPWVCRGARPTRWSTRLRADRTECCRLQPQSRCSEPPR